ncbi:uncharacterized protein LOC143064924 isoform X1 [Mytilus galloprovincialis]|uniref:uncharacterized protein LOC143064924 isoform X1 n=1 Tax=Mytilus galloprovincialis TaxID=29158 RepID=UPI003F7B77A8
MGDPRLYAGMEDVSLKKHLPLRQTAQKPMLKYQPVAKQLHAFHQSDGVYSPNDVHHSYSNLSQASDIEPMVPAPFRISRTNNSVSSYRQGGQTYVSPNNIGKPVPPTKSNTNPYARPLSAKDIVNDLQNQQSQKIKKNKSALQVNPGQSQVPFPVNSFMRPQSAIKKEAPITKEIISRLNENNNREQSSSSSGSRTSQTSTPVSETAKSSSVLKTVTSNLNLMNGQVTTIETNGTTVIQKVTPPANFSAQINNIITKVTENPKIIQNGQTKPVVRQVSSIPKPGSASNSNSSKSSTPELPSKVRNLNYTPTKPYNEVMNPPSDEEVVVNKTQGNKPLQTTATTVTPPAEPKPKSITSSVSATYIKTSPIENKSNGGSNTIENKSNGGSNTIENKSNNGSNTMFYRKGSKSEEMLHEQRPPAVGSPTKGKQREKLEKADRAEEGSEDEGEEDEDSVPGERFPGDGEASDDLDDDDDDDVIDCLEDDNAGGSEGESDGYSITSSLSRRSSSGLSRSKSARQIGTVRSVSSTSADEVSVRPVSTTRPQTAVVKTVIKQPLTKSLFPGVPPTINFVVEGEKVEQLPWEYRRLMKWRMSPITPNIVKHSLARIGFRITKRNHDWLGCWGKHMKSQGFKGIKEWQKLNHFPGTFQIGRKDKLWRNLSKMQLHFGKKEFGFFPQTYCLPYDNKLLKRAWEDGGNKQKWIIKPPASARGIGIKVIHKWNQIPRKKSVIVQKYLGRPYLINESKFDMRVYVYVSSYDPLRIYVFEDGLARFASCKYSNSMKNLNNKFMHLTNYSVNKKNADYQANGDEGVCQGHKWGLKALWNYMKRQGINTNAIWDSIKDLVVKTIICAESPINSLIKSNSKSKYCCHELFGFDVMLDESLKPWILEVNISPSLHSNSQLDINIKGHMIRDLFNIAGFRIPDKTDVSHSSAPGTSATEFSSYHPPNDYCMDKRLFTQQMAPDERAKHAFYCQRHQDDQTLQTMLDVLTPDDMRVLIESIDEDSRKGGFQRVFPTPSTHKYLRFFESARYYNLLLDQWVQRFNRMEQKGILILESFCEEGVHLENPSSSPHHQWSSPNSLNSHRDLRMQSAPLSKHAESKDPKSVKHSASSSQLPKVSKKPPKAPVHASSHTSQNGSVSLSTTPSPSYAQSPAPSYANAKVTVNPR